MEVVLATIYFVVENFTTIFKRNFENVVDNVFFNFGPLNIDLLLRLCNKYYGWQELLLGENYSPTSSHSLFILYY